MNILEMSNIYKSFYGVSVLKDVSFSVKEGEVHALLGENGAGKSTLMNILASVYTRDNGTVAFNGKAIPNNSTIQYVEDCGVAFVHQDLNLFNDLKVYENMFLTKEITNKFGLLNQKAMIAECDKLFLSLGVDIDPKEMVERLETSKKQLLEIAKALFSNAKLIILDEPTTSLNKSEIEHLFSIVNDLKKKGVAFIFISHKMTEIFDISDRYSVLRNGELVSVGEMSDITPQEITRLMVGESYKEGDSYAQRKLGETVLEVKNLSAKGFRNINLTVKRGEILGLTGLKGAGVSSFLKTLFGNNPIVCGSIEIKGKEVALSNIKQAMKQGIAMVSANRKENSIVPDFTLLENTYIAEHVLSAKKLFISKKNEIAKYDKYKSMLSIKANSHEDMITSLSGGNQQKVILGRWLNTEADILLLDNPTQGIDVGAKAEIYKLILKLSEQGKTILVNTLEIPEIMQIADKCAVFYQGEIKVVLDRNDINEQQVMLYATNAIAISGGNN